MPLFFLVASAGALKCAAQNPSTPLSTPPAPLWTGVRDLSPRFRGYNGMLVLPMERFSLNYWKQPNYLKIGAILNGVIEDDISSNRSKPGDSFTITLVNGYSDDGIEILPRQTRIVGTIVSAMPAKMMHGYMPGKLEVSLQTMVFPDGRHTRFYGYLAHNPVSDYKTNPRNKTIKEDFANYGLLLRNSVTGFLGTVSRHAGLPLGTVFGRYSGPEFKIEKGELLATQVSRSIDLSHMDQINGTAGTNSWKQPTVPINTGSRAFVSGNANDMPPMAPSIVRAPNMMPDHPQLPGVANSPDPNQIFNVMPQRARADIADPF